MLFVAQVRSGAKTEVQSIPRLQCREFSLFEAPGSENFGDVGRGLRRAAFRQPAAWFSPTETLDDAARQYLWFIDAGTGDDDGSIIYIQTQ